MGALIARLRVGDGPSALAAGFLARLREDDELIKAVRETWERPIRGVMRHLGVPDEHFDHALFPYNMMFDPREILDLTSTGLAETTRSIG